MPPSPQSTSCDVYSDFYRSKVAQSQESSNEFRPGKAQVLAEPGNRQQCRLKLLLPIDDTYTALALSKSNQTGQFSYENHLNHS
jgi:hypothetical protein